MLAFRKIIKLKNNLHKSHPFSLSWLTRKINGMDFLTVNMVRYIFTILKSSRVLDRNWLYVLSSFRDYNNKNDDGILAKSRETTQEYNISNRVELSILVKNKQNAFINFGEQYLTTSCVLIKLLNGMTFETSHLILMGERKVIYSAQCLCKLNEVNLHINNKFLTLYLTCRSFDHTFPIFISMYAVDWIEYVYSLI